MEEEGGGIKGVKECKQPIIAQDDHQSSQQESSQLHDDDAYLLIGMSEYSPYYF